MKKSVNLSSKKGNPEDKLKKSFFWVAGIAVFLFVLFFLFRKDNFFRWVGTSVTIRRQEKEILKLEKENLEMEERIRNLRENRDTLEAFARERYHFTSEGEDLYIIE